MPRTCGPRRLRVGTRQGQVDSSVPEGEAQGETVATNGRLGEDRKGVSDELLRVTHRWAEVGEPELLHPSLSRQSGRLAKSHVLVQDRFVLIGIIAICPFADEEIYSSNEPRQFR